MFNNDTLVFGNGNLLESARGIPLEWWLGLGVSFGVFHLFRFYAMWSLGNRLGVRLWLTSLVPFLWYFSYMKLGRDVLGWKPVTRLLYKIIGILYAVSLGMIAFGSSQEMIISGLITYLLVRVFSWWVLLTISLGVTGRRRWFWLFPVCGGIYMMWQVRKSYRTDIWVRSRNYDGLFKKSEDIEIVL